MSVLLRHVQGARRGSPRRLRPAGLALIAVLAAGALSLLIGPALAAKVVIGTVGTSGSGAGQVLYPQGVAVNYGGTGGADAGDIYVVDNGNHRIDQFHSDGSFVRAFGWGVKQGDAAPYSFDVCTDSTGCQAGQSGAGAGQLSARPAGIAVDQVAGNLYVTDQSNFRIDVFSAAGDFEGAFGYGVVAGDVAPYSLDFCTPATGCQAGQSGPAAGQISNQVPDVAVDPSSGNIYIADQANNRIDEFKPTLSGGAVTGIEFVHAFGWGVRTGASQLESCTAASGCQKGASGGGDGELGTLQSVAIDSSGAIYAVSTSNLCLINQYSTNPCRVEKFTADATSATEFAPGQLTITDGTRPYQKAASQIAIDPANDHVFVAQAQGGSVRNVFGVKEFDSSGNLVDVSPPGAGISGGPANGLAVGPGAALYFDNNVVNVFGTAPAPAASILPVGDIGSTTATFNGTVTPAGGYDTTYHFEYSSDGVTWLDWPAEHDVDVGSGNKPVTVHQHVTGLEPNQTYTVRLVATTGTPATSSTTTFTTFAASPSVSGTAAVSVERSSAKLTAYVNPNNSPTTYHFEWGRGTSYGHQLPGFELFAGSGGKPVRVSANVTDLSPDTTYHFRLVATNASKGVTVGPDQAFRTLNVVGLPDDRGYELVSPADKGTTGKVRDPIGNEIRFQVSPGGDSVVYPLQFGLPSSTSGSGAVRYLAERGESGWRSAQLTPPSLVPPLAGDPDNNQPGIYLYFSKDLSCGVLQSIEPLTSGAPADGTKSLYRRNGDGSFTLISSVGTSEFQGASVNCGHIAFTSAGLQEWANGAVRNVGVLPSGNIAPDAIAGGDGSAWNAVSGDGSRIFFSATSDQGGDRRKKAIFVRTDGTSTVDVSQSQTATVDDGADFQLASRDGSRVVFIANHGLTATSSSAGSDLYEASYDSSTDQWGLTDLSADRNSDDTGGASVGGVLGASDDASYVYFAAAGQLVPGRGQTYSRNQKLGNYNIYLAHAGHLAFVGILAARDVTPTANNFAFIEGSGRMPADNSKWSSRVTPDGRHLLFASSANVTGYDSGGVAEAYLFSAGTGATACVSCRPDGQPSVGDAATQPLTTSLSSSGHGGDGNLDSLHRPVAVTDDGARVFFTMPDVLAAGAKAGEVNVYEWQHGEVYLLATGDVPNANGGLALVGASSDGDDVFITTSKQLAPQDVDRRADVYDVRVDGGFPASTPAPECDPLGGECQGSGATAPAFAPIGSVSLAESGNVMPPKRKTRAVRKLALRGLSRAARRHLARGGRGRLIVRVKGGGVIRVRVSAKVRGRRRTVAKAKHVVHRESATTVRLRLRLSHAARRTLAHRGRLRVRILARLRGVKGSKRESVILRRPSTRRSKAPRAGRADATRAGRSVVRRGQRMSYSGRGGAK